MKKILCAACALLIACSGLQPQRQDVSALERECVRDPLNPDAWERLAAALAEEGERERAATMYLQAATLRTHDVQQDYAVLRQELHALQEAQRGTDMPRTEVRRIGPALVEVLRVGGEASLPAVRLEISNGNGVTGAARRLARSLDVSGVKTVRLTNRRPFVEANSRIEYWGGQQNMAQALGRHLGMKSYRVRGGLADADMRVVLGHDEIKKPSRRDLL